MAEIWVVTLADGKPITKEVWASAEVLALLRSEGPRREILQEVVEAARLAVRREALAEAGVSA